MEPTISIANALSVEQKDNQDLGIPTRLVEGEVDEHTDRSCMRPSQNIFISEICNADAISESFSCAPGRRTHELKTSSGTPSTAPDKSERTIQK